MRRSSSISIADVAKRAQVSISTVSRVVNRSNLVNEVTRRRVQAAIDELGYRPNLFARGLMTRRSEIVGLVLPDLHGEFYSEIIRGASTHARASGYNLMVSSARDQDDADSLLQAVGEHRLLDGVVIMLSELTSDAQERITAFKIPFVLLDVDLPGMPHDSVVIDQRHGATAIVEHLIRNCGARRIIFVGGPENNIDTQERLHAYRHVLATHELPRDNADVHHLDYNFDSAYELARRHLRSWAQPGCCVFAANDEMAAGIVAAAAASDIRVPEELSVVGFDDTRIAGMTHPPLTTVRVPKFEMGARATELLCRRLADPERTPTRIALPPELVVRESCGHRIRT